MNNADDANVQPDFSLVLGGPVYRFFCWLRLSDAQLEPAYRRPLFLATVAWLPLFLMSLFEGRAFSGVQVPFIYDVESHARFLVALPLLLADETLVRRLLAPLINNFLTRKIVREDDVHKFKAAVSAAHKLRDSNT